MDGNSSSLSHSMLWILMGYSDTRMAGLTLGSIQSDCQLDMGGVRQVPMWLSSTSSFQVDKVSSLSPPNPIPLLQGKSVWFAEIR